MKSVIIVKLLSALLLYETKNKTEKTDVKIVRKRTKELGNQLGKTFI